MNTRALSDLFLSKITSIPIREVVDDAIAAHEPDIIAINQQQLQAGQDATGRAIAPFYAPLTVKIKRAKGQRTDRVTLKDTGDFYDGFYTKSAGPGRTEVSSTDKKTSDLEDKYGDVFGLSTASLSALSRRIVPTLQRLFRGYLNRP